MPEAQPATATARAPAAGAATARAATAAATARASGAYHPIDTDADVETPEHVHFHYRAAGPARRALAYLLDTVIRGVVFVGAVMALFTSFSAFDELAKASGGLVLLALFALEWGYFVFFETIMSGQTPGKAAARLRVVKEGGYPIQFVDSVLRNLLRAADFLPAAYALGLLVMGRDERFRRLGDLVAGTMVVVEERAMVAARLVMTPPATVEELDALPSRPDLDVRDLEAIELFLRRRATLAKAREAELAEMVAPLYARRMGLGHADASRLLALLYQRATQRSG